MIPLEAAEIRQEPQMSRNHYAETGLQQSVHLGNKAKSWLDIGVLHDRRVFMPADSLRVQAFHHCVQALYQLILKVRMGCVFGDLVHG